MSQNIFTIVSFLFDKICFTLLAFLRYTDHMFENKNKLRGKFVCSKSKAELKSSQITRSIILGIALACFVVPPLFLKSQAIKVFSENNYTPFITTYVMLVLFTAAMLLYTFIASLTRYRFRSEVPEKYAPRSGFEKHTFACFEWSKVLTVIVAIVYAGMCAYAYSHQSVVLAILECVAAALTVYARKITFDTYSSSLTLVPVDEVSNATENLDEETEKNALASDNNATDTMTKMSNTRLKTDNPDAEKNLSDEVEDFYDDKD